MSAAFLVTFLVPNYYLSCDYAFIQCNFISFTKHTAKHNQFKRFDELNHSIKIKKNVIAEL